MTLSQSDVKVLRGCAESIRKQASCTCSGYKHLEYNLHCSVSCAEKIVAILDAQEAAQGVGEPIITERMKQDGYAALCASEYVKGDIGSQIGFAAMRDVWLAMNAALPQQPQGDFVVDALKHYAQQEFQEGMTRCTLATYALDKLAAAPQPESGGDARELAEKIKEAYLSYFDADMGICHPDELEDLIAIFSARIRAETIEECAKVADGYAMESANFDMAAEAETFCNLANRIRQLGKRGA